MTVRGSGSLDSAAESPHHVTRLLRCWSEGSAVALDQLMSRVYPRLRLMAAGLMRGERPTLSLEVTGLVHETYLKLCQLHSCHYRDRGHFFSMSARLMRRVLVDQARYRGRLKRLGEKRPRAEAEGRLVEHRASRLVALDEALADLERVDHQRAAIVELRFFAGLERDQIAAVLGISSATVTRRWRSARAWLLLYLSSQQKKRNGVDPLCRRLSPSSPKEDVP